MSSQPISAWRTTRLRTQRRRRGYEDCQAIGLHAGAIKYIDPLPSPPPFRGREKAGGAMIAPEPDGSSPLLAVRGVETYYGRIPALKGVDMEVREGEIVALIGANGAGKSTLMMTICGNPRDRKSVV